METKFKVGDLVEVVGRKSQDDRTYNGQRIIIGKLDSTHSAGPFNYIDKYLCPLTGEELPNTGGIWLTSVKLVEEPIIENYEIY